MKIENQIEYKMLTEAQADIPWRLPSFARQREITTYNLNVASMESRRFNICGERVRRNTEVHPTVNAAGFSALL